MPSVPDAHPPRCQRPHPTVHVLRPMTHVTRHLTRAHIRVRSPLVLCALWWGRYSVTVSHCPNHPGSLFCADPSGDGTPCAGPAEHRQDPDGHRMGAHGRCLSNLSPARSSLLPRPPLSASGGPGLHLDAVYLAAVKRPCLSVSWGWALWSDAHGAGGPGCCWGLCSPPDSRLPSGMVPLVRLCLRAHGSLAAFGSRRLSGARPHTQGHWLTLSLVPRAVLGCVGPGAGGNGVSDT